MNALPRRTLRNHDAWFRIHFIFSLRLLDILTLQHTSVIIATPRTSCLSILEAIELFSSL